MSATQGSLPPRTSLTHSLTQLLPQGAPLRSLAPNSKVPPKGPHGVMGAWRRVICSAWEGAQSPEEAPGPEQVPKAIVQLRCL
jgi:hypothetical protein